MKFKVQKKFKERNPQEFTAMTFLEWLPFSWGCPEHLSGPHFENTDAENLRKRPRPCNKVGRKTRQDIQQKAGH